MFINKYLIKTSYLFKPTQCHYFPIKTFSYYPVKSFWHLNSNNDESKKVDYIEKSKNRLDRSKLKRLYEISKKMNVLKYFKKEVNEQKLIEFLQKVQGVTFLGIYEAVSLTYLFNYFDFLNGNMLYLGSGGMMLAFGSLYFLQKLNKPQQNKFMNFFLFQSLIVSLSMIFSTFIMSITNPIIIPSIYIITASSCMLSQVANYYLAKKRWALPFGIFVGGIINTYLIMYGLSYFSFVAVGNNPFVYGYHNFWVKNEIYLINAIFALNTSSAVKGFRKGESEYIGIALGFYLKFVKKFVGFLSYLLRKIKNK